MKHASGQISTRHPMHGALIAVTKPNADGRPVSITNEPRRRKYRVTPVLPATSREATARAAKSFHQTTVQTHEPAAVGLRQPS